jgi:hypothetical protein
VTANPHYRVINGKTVYVADPSTADAPEAGVRERTAIGKFRDGSSYLRATDAEDGRMICKAAQELGIPLQKRRAGAAHFGRIGAYDHFHASTLEEAAMVHAALDPEQRELLKGHVKGHVRNVNGKLVQVREHDTRKAETINKATEATVRAHQVMGHEAQFKAHKEAEGLHQEAADVMKRHHESLPEGHADKPKYQEAEDYHRKWSAAHGAEAKRLAPHMTQPDKGAGSEIPPELPVEAREKKPVDPGKVASDPGHKNEEWPDKGEDAGQPSGDEHGKDPLDKGAQPEEGHEAVRAQASAASYKATNAVATYGEKAELHRQAAEAHSKASKSALAHKVGMDEGRGASATHATQAKYHLGEAKKYDDAQASMDEEGRAIQKSIIERHISHIEQQKGKVGGDKIALDALQMRQDALRDQLK